MTALEPVVAHASQVFHASPEEVFDAWLDPDLLGEWMFGPAVRQEEVVRLTLEPRVGGEFSFLVRRGENEIDHIGRYFEIDRPRRLVFSWGIAPDSPDDSRVVIEIAPTAEGCELTLRHELHPDWANYLDRTAEAWAKMLSTLHRHLDGSSGQAAEGFAGADQVGGTHPR